MRKLAAASWVDAIRASHSRSGAWQTWALSPGPAAAEGFSGAAAVPCSREGLTSQEARAESGDPGEARRPTTGLCQDEDGTLKPRPSALGLHPPTARQGVSFLRPQALRSGHMPAGLMVPGASL